MCKIYDHSFVITEDFILKKILTSAFKILVKEAKQRSFTLKTILFLCLKN